MMQLNEPVECSLCESPTFRIQKKHLGAPDIGATDIIVYCSKCGKKYYTVHLERAM